MQAQPLALQPCGFQRQGGHQPHTPQGRDGTARREARLTPNTKHGARGAGRETPVPSATSRAPRWEGTVGKSSPLPVQWGCSPLQLRCQPGAGGHRPAGSSKMQDWAQPPAGRWERGGAPGTAHLAGARGTRKGNGGQHRRGARWDGEGRGRSRLVSVFKGRRVWDGTSRETRLGWSQRNGLTGGTATPHAHAAASPISRPNP